MRRAHTITSEGRACDECHNTAGSNAAITQYNETGMIRFAEWDAQICPPDFDSDRLVGFNDLVMLLGDWGGCRADLDGDGSTGFNDLSMLLGTWGACP